MYVESSNCWGFEVYYHQGLSKGDITKNGLLLVSAEGD